MQPRIFSGESDMDLIEEIWVVLELFHEKIGHFMQAVSRPIDKARIWREQRGVSSANSVPLSMCG